MQRIITFGCSMTYGHGLPDCHVPPNNPGSSPSQQGWPNILSKYYNIALDNRSVCGNSNLAILHDVLKYKFLKGDIAVIMWSFTGRDLIFDKKNLFGKQKTIPVGIWQDTELANHWKAVHTDADVATRSWFYIHHATLFLKSVNVPVYNVPADYRFFKKYKPKFLNLEYHNIGKYATVPVDYALDNRHPGLKTQKLIADKIKKIINSDLKILK
jgi:hypothetical protein